MCLWIHHGVHKWAGRAQHLYKSLSLFSPAAADLWFRHPQMVWPLFPDPALADHHYPAEIQVTALMGKKWEANQIMGGENGREWVGVFNLWTPALTVSVSLSLSHLHAHSPVKGDSPSFPYVSAEFENTSAFISSTLFNIYVIGNRQHNLRIACNRRDDLKN